MSSTSPEIKTYNQMRNTFRRLTVVALSTSVLGVLLSAYMFYLATPPVNADFGAYDKWLTDHQEQFLAEEGGRFYWTETHSAFLFGGIAIFLFLVAMCSVQILIVAKVAKVTAKAVLVEARNEKTE